MSLRKNETLTGWTLLDTFCLHFWAWLLLYSVITPKSEDKKCPKVFNPPEFHFSEVTFFQNWYFRTKVTWLDNCSNWANVSKTQLSHYVFGLKSVSFGLNKKNSAGSLKILRVQNVMSWRSAGSWTRCTRSNAFPEAKEASTLLVSRALKVLHFHELL